MNCQDQTLICSSLELFSHVDRFYGVDGLMILDTWDRNQERNRFYGVDETLVFDSRLDRNGGLPEEAIAKHMKSGSRDAVVGDCGICVVCLDDLFQENGKIARLDCAHEYHAQCIKKWLKLKNNCPMCKATALVAS